MLPRWPLLAVAALLWGCRGKQEARRDAHRAPAPTGSAPATASARPAVSAAPVECRPDTWAHYGHDVGRTSLSGDCVEGPLEVLWRAKAVTPVKERPPAFEHAVVTAEGVYATGIRGKSSMLHALNLDGTPRWDHDTRTDLHFAFWPMVAGDLAAMNDDGTFFLDLQTGKMKLNLGLDSWGQMATDGERFYWVNTWHVHGPALYLGAFSLAGETLWKQNKYGGTAPMDMMDDLGGVALDGGVVFQAANYKFASFSGISAFDGPTGKLRWYKSTTAVSYLSAAHDRLFAVERVRLERKAVARSQQTGEELWSTPLKGALGASPALAGGLVLIDTERGALVALDEATGKERWRTEIGGKRPPCVGNETTVAVAANGVVVATAGKEMLLLGLEQGDIRWRGAVAEACVHSPVIAGGKVYAVAGGEIVALGRRQLGPLDGGLGGANLGGVMCPACHRDAPLVFRDGGAFCKACGAPRPALSRVPIGFAGEPQRFGGKVSAGLGWALLLGGLLLAATVSGFGWLIFHSIALAKYVGLPLLVASSLFGGGAVALGRRLERSGARALRQARVSALRGLAARQGGAVSVLDAAGLLKVTPRQADSLLTELAKAEEAHLEVTEQGALLYHFDRPALRSAMGGVRVATPRPEAPIDDEIEELEATVEPPRRAAR